MSSSLKPIFPRFHIIPSIDEILTIYSNDFAPLNKMATMPIYGKKHIKIYFSRTKKALCLNLYREKVKNSFVAE